MVVTLDGEILTPDTPLICADDLAVVRGDGVFETLLVRDGGACLVEAHLARLSHSAKLMDLPEPDPAAWRLAIDTAARRWAAATADEGAMRLVYSRGRESGSAPTAYVTVNPLARASPQPPRRVAAVTLPRGLPAGGTDAMPWLLAGAKTLSYAVNMAALRHAARMGAGDAIFVSSDGYVLESPRSTVVIAAPAKAAAPPCSPHRRGIRSCAAPPSRRSSKWRAAKATTAITGLTCIRSLCGPRYLAGVEHDVGGAGTHTRRPTAAAGPDGRGIRRTCRRRYRQRPLSWRCPAGVERVRSALHRKGGGPTN
ncbi:aminotransferase class IV family protein [Mycobacterium xenopi 4042]|uniref:Aminotransferase class IV family protein n=1 Tax=Mycobacterium xenopi 4042 TaxID=1299334 RepID=X7ZUX0_MYCXE|nr:aminotransferase class IV family protein [Mycobacterium xenopi 4042]